MAVNSPAANKQERVNGRSTSDAVSRQDSRRRLGAYYTPETAAEYMASWTIRGEHEHYLEPSLGDGMFLRSVAECARRRSVLDIRLSGVEIDSETLRRVTANKTLPNANLRLADFLEVAPFPVQAVIGNPPYVRLRALSKRARALALRSAAEVLGSEMDPSGSTWMPFVLHAVRFLAPGGRLALVLPYDLTYVRYARPLWRLLGERFGELQILRTRERLFPDILQDVVILLADRHGESTEHVSYKAFIHVADMYADRPAASSDIAVADIVAGKRPFKAALLSPALQQLLSRKLARHLSPARDLVTFNIGYVAGDKGFFHPDTEAVASYSLPERSLPKTLTSARRMKGAGLNTSTVSAKGIDRLFVPKPSNLSDGEKRYIRFGEREGVSERYKCKVRTPWYVVPGVRIPDVLVSVFTERPVLRVNDAQFRASNSLLCGYLKEATSEEVVTRWYTSLTLLMCELEVHSLGGGVMILVPREAGNILLPSSTSADSRHIQYIDEHLRQGDSEGAYACGDLPVLSRQLGLSDEEIALIHDGIATLTHWRTGSRDSAARCAT